MAVEELAKILNEMVKDGKGDYEVITYDWTVGSFSVVDECKLIQLTM